MKKEKNSRGQLIQPGFGTYFMVHFVWVWMLGLLSFPISCHAYRECAAGGLEESGTVPFHVCLQLDHIQWNMEGGPEGVVWWAADLTTHDLWKDGPRLSLLLLFFSLYAFPGHPDSCLPALLHIWHLCDPTLLDNPLKSIYFFSNGLIFCQVMKVSPVTEGFYKCHSHCKGKWW